MDIPSLRTDRLILRAFRADDLDSFAAMHANPQVMRHLGPGVTRSREETWDAMARMLGQWPLRGYGMFAVEEASTGRFAGRAGLLHPAHWPEAELAFGLDSPFWGQGLATEAARALHRWAFHERQLPALVSYIRPANTASINVVRKLGASRIALLDLFGGPAEKWQHQPDGAVGPDRR
jgi:RimJ/RimL family protein N-acetyltransferase